MTLLEAARTRPAGRRLWLALAAYLVPSFPIAFVWHLMLFAPAYEALAIYRDDMIVPFGFASMIVQGAVFAWVYPRLFGERSGALQSGLVYGLGLGLLSWTYTTLAVAAKHPMTSISDFMLLETGFTVLQFLVVGPLIALAHRV